MIRVLKTGSLLCRFVRHECSKGDNFFIFMSVIRTRLLQGKNCNKVRHGTICSFHISCYSSDGRDGQRFVKKLFIRQKIALDVQCTVKRSNPTLRFLLIVTFVANLSFWCLVLKYRVIKTSIHHDDLVDPSEGKRQLVAQWVKTKKKLTF